MGRPTNTQFAVAVHVLTMLGAKPDEVMSSETMAASVGSNAVHVRRVLGLLRGAGLVESRPGVHGGWTLRRPRGEITLADAWRAVQKDDPVLGLHFANPDCPAGQRIRRALLGLERDAAHAVEAELERTTICDIVQATDAEPARVA
jgi:Rrf2 family protein